MKKKIMNSISDKCKKIKIVLTDVDGVLTDGGMYYTKDGDIMKKFHARDGMGVTLLRKKSIPTIIITKEKTSMVKKWSSKMKVAKLYDGIIEKESMIKIISEKFQVNTSEMAYIGDDINDLNLLEKVGFSVSPKDGMEFIRKKCDYISKTKGGEGVFREVAELILKNQ
jgi:YrbI family 3-deoxy-D-manno-octulosonate 8-phosphate phosphatase